MTTSLGPRRAIAIRPSAIIFQKTERRGSKNSWQIAFEVERIPGGIITIYVPGAPDPWSGSVCYMTEDRIQTIDPAMSPVLKTLKDLGKGSNEQLSAYFKHK